MLTLSSFNGEVKIKRKHDCCSENLKSKKTDLQVQRNHNAVRGLVAGGMPTTYLPPLRKLKTKGGRDFRK
jgi:hypothetical protein